MSSQPQIQWPQVLLFGAVLLVYVVISWLLARYRRKKKRRNQHRGFKKMKSPAQRARERAERNDH